MKFRDARSLFALSLMAASCSVTQVQAQTVASDSPVFTVGLKLWQNKWTSWDVYPPLGIPSPLCDGGVCNLPGASENFTSGSESTFIPFVSMRYKDFLLSGSYFANTHYSFRGADNTPFKAERKEVDGLVGYYVLPTLALTLGYKGIDQDFGTDRTFKYTGPIIGVVASAPLTKGFSLYGNVAYGFMTAKLPSFARDQTGKSRLDANYLLGEVGIAYSFDVQSLWPSAKALTATLGYRGQVLETKNYKLGLSTIDPSAVRSTELRDTTEGFAIGLSASF